MLLTIAEYVFGGVVLLVLYQIFISDWIDDKLQSYKSKTQGLSAAEKLAQVKLVSHNAKDIETFISKNADNLSDTTVTKLVSRIEAISNEQVISADNLLENQFKALENAKK
jgi:hypothetical protein